MLRIVSKKESAANLFAAAPFVSRMDFPVRVSLANSPHRGPKFSLCPERWSERKTCGDCGQRHFDANPAAIALRAATAGDIWSRPVCAAKAQGSDASCGRLAADSFCLSLTSAGLFLGASGARGTIEQKKVFRVCAAEFGIKHDDRRVLDAAARGRAPEWNGFLHRGW